MNAAFPLDSTNSGNTRHTAGIRRLNHSDFPSFPRYGMIYYGSLVRYLAAQVKTLDLGECGTGRSGRGTAVSDPIYDKNLKSRIFL
jgi:hypothetical protein